MDFYAPQFQPPADILGAYLRGQAAPLQLQQEQQKTEEGALSLQQMRLAMQMHQQQMAQLAQVYGQPSGGPQAAPPGATPPANATPQGAGMPAAGGSPLDNFISSAGDRLSKLAQIGSINAAYSGGDPIKPFKDALETQSAERDSQIKAAQLQAQMTGSPLSIMRSFANNPNAGDAMLKNPQMIPHWEQAATTVGRNPNDLSNENVRTTAALIARQHEAALQFPEAQWTKMPVLYSKPTAGPGGSLTQTNLDTGKQETVVGREPAAVLALNSMSTEGERFAYDAWKKTGKLPVAVGRSAIASATLLNKFAQFAKEDGDTGASTAASQAAYHANQGALTANTKLLTATSGYAQTLEKNLNNLEQSYSKVDSTGSPLVNKAVRQWQQGVSGDPQTADMILWLKSVQSEFAKLRSGSLGNAPLSDAAMADSAKVINEYMNQGGIKAVASAIRQEKDNRISSLQEQNDQLNSALGGNKAHSGGTVTLYKNGIAHNIPADKADDAMKNYGYTQAK